MKLHDSTELNKDDAIQDGIKYYHPDEETEKYSERTLWGYNIDRTPKMIVEYFKSMEYFLKARKLITEYCPADNAMRISPLSQDYETKSKLFIKFVEEYGYGPFSEVHQLTFTGEYVKEPILVKNKTQ